MLILFVRIQCKNQVRQVSADGPYICDFKSSVFCLKLLFPVLLQINLIYSQLSCEGSCMRGSSMRSSSLSFDFAALASEMRLSICSYQAKCSLLATVSTTNQVSAEGSSVGRKLVAFTLIIGFGSYYFGQKALSDFVKAADAMFKPLTDVKPSPYERSAFCVEINGEFLRFSFEFGFFPNQFLFKGANRFYSFDYLLLAFCDQSRILTFDC